MSGNSFYCQPCDRTFKIEHEFKQHCLSKKHAFNKQLALEQEAASRKIYVRGFGDVWNPQEFLATHFSKFGNIIKITLNGKHGNAYAFVEFENPEAVSRVLYQGRHRAGRFSLYVKRFFYQPPKWDKRFIHQQQEHDNKKKQNEAYGHMMDILTSAENLTDQINLVSEKLRLPAEDEKVRAQICHELTGIVSPHIENCSVHQFGSSINGFGTKGCDLDLFLDIYNQVSSVKNGEDKVEEKTKIQQPSHSVKKLNHDPLTKEQLNNMDLYKVVKLLSQILTNKGSIYSDILTIPSNRCPVVKFTHNASRIKCDLSLNNRKALHNSLLLRFYGSEPRVHKLVIAVQLWARFNELAATGTHLFTSYAIRLITIFYVMQKKPKLIPLVSDLEKSVKGVGKEIVDDWECVTIPPDASLPLSENTETVVELLRGFFDFCANSVNWDTDALVTRNATIISRSQISQDPAYMGCKAGCLTVLDPFVLTHNVAGNINEKTKIRFVAECKRAAELTRDWPVCELGSRTNPWGLAVLMVPSEEPKPEKSDNKSKSRPSKWKDKGHGEAAVGEGGHLAKSHITRVEGEQENGEFYIALQPLLSSSSVGVTMGADKSDIISSMLEWCHSAQDMVLDILKTVFMVEMVDKSGDEVKEQASEEKLNNLKEKVNILSATTGNCSVSQSGAVDQDSMNIDGKDRSNLKMVASIDDAEEKREVGSRDINVAAEVENENELRSGKRTSEVAHLDGSSSESLERPLAGDHKNHPAKEQNPRKRLCERVGISLPEETSLPTCEDGSFNVTDPPTLDNKKSTCDKFEMSNISESSSKGISTDNEDRIERLSIEGNDSSTSPDGGSNIEPLSDTASPLSTSNIKILHQSSYQCTCKHQLWLMRKQVRARIPIGQQHTDLAVEQEISQLVLTEMDKLMQKLNAASNEQGQADSPKGKVHSMGHGETGQTQLHSTDSKSKGETLTNPKFGGQQIKKTIITDMAVHGQVSQDTQITATDSRSKAETANSEKLHGQQDQKPRITYITGAKDVGITSSSKKLQAAKLGSKSKMKDITSQSGKNSPGKGISEQEVKRFAEGHIEFLCEIFQQCYTGSGLPHILVKMRPSEKSLSAFKNFFCSYRSMVLRLIKSHTLNR